MSRCIFSGIWEATRFETPPLALELGRDKQANNMRTTYRQHIIQLAVPKVERLDLGVRLNDPNQDGACTGLTQNIRGDRGRGRRRERETGRPGEGETGG